MAQGAAKLEEFEFEGAEKNIKTVAEHTINIGKQGLTSIFSDLKL